MSTRSRSPSAAAALAVSLLVPFSALAAESVGVLAVSDPPGPSPALVDATAQFRTVLSGHAPGVLDAAELRQRMVGQAPTASLSEIDRALAGAMATYQAGDYEAAIRTLRSIIEEIERLPDGEEAFAQWTRAMLRLARAEQTVGHRAESRAALERLVRANPLVKVDLNQYPPSFAQQVDSVRAELAARPKRKLTVTSAQKGVTVYVEGRQVGTAPVVLLLVPGRYRVSGAAQGLRVPGVSADLFEADQNVSLDLALAGALRPEGGPGLALPREDRALKTVAAAAWLGLDRVVAMTTVVEADVSYLQGTLFEVRRGVMSREARVRLAGGLPPPGGLSALAAFLMTGRSSELVTQPPAQPVAVAPAVAPVAAAPAAEGAPAPAPAAAASQPEAPAAAAPAPDLHAAPPPDRFALAEGGAGKARSPILMWSPVVGAGLAVGLGAVAAYSGLKSNDSYSKANAMLQNGSLRFGASPAQYNGHIGDGNSSRRLAAGAGIAAGVTLAASATLAYLNHRETGKYGPFGF